MKIWIVLLLAFSSVAFAEAVASLGADRAAIEHVYYYHRLGEKPPFEQTLPPDALENLVRQDSLKEAVLKQVYAIEISPSLLDTEVRRINTTTRAPDVLAEIKAALDNDPVRFANAFAKPILVERLLREKFNNDASLHTTQRRQFEQIRSELLAAKTNGADYKTLLALLKNSNSNAVTETIWEFAARPAETNAPHASEIEIKKQLGPGAQIISPTQTGGTREKYYFEDLSPELQNVLRVQLRKPGDVSAVIETPSGFLLYVAKEKTDAVLSVAGLSLPKRSYDQWLAEQAGH